MRASGVWSVLAGVLVVVATLGAVGGLARAQEGATSSETGLARVAGPTSGAASILSGRTLGSDQRMLAAALGWPGVWAELALAPGSEVNVHVRGSVLYGSPVMGLVAGAGGELAVPVRVHVFGEGNVDLAIRMTPRIAMGEGAIFGERTGLGGALAGALLFDTHGVFGIQVDPNVTVVVGAGGGAGASVVDGSSQGIAWIARVAGELGVEALMARDTMLFAHVEGGYGFAPERTGLAFYGAREVLSVSLGLGYLL
jgi:hypothetical protein